MKSKWAGLVTSRKLWIGVTGVIVSVGAHIGWHVSEEVVMSTLAVVCAIILGIAGEDAAKIVKNGHKE